MARPSFQRRKVVKSGLAQKSTLAPLSLGPHGVHSEPLDCAGRFDDLRLVGTFVGRASVRDPQKILLLSE
jgi:hypothetical protein